MRAEKEAKALDCFDDAFDWVVCKIDYKTTSWIRARAALLSRAYSEPLSDERKGICAALMACRLVFCRAGVGV